MSEYEKNVAQTIKSYLDNNQLHYAYDEKKGHFYMTLSIDSSNEKVKMVITLHPGYYQVHASFYIECPQENKYELLKLLNNINNECLMGHFEIVEENIIQYREVIFSKDMPSYQTIKNSIFVPCYTIEKYGAIIREVCNGTTCDKAWHKEIANKMN